MKNCRLYTRTVIALLPILWPIDDWSHPILKFLYQRFTFLSCCAVVRINQIYRFWSIIFMYFFEHSIIFLFLLFLEGILLLIVFFWFILIFLQPQTQLKFLLISIVHINVIFNRIQMPCRWIALRNTLLDFMTCLSSHTLIFVTLELLFI